MIFYLKVLRMAPGSSDEKGKVHHAKILEIHLEEMMERVCQAQVKENRIIQWQDLEGMYWHLDSWAPKTEQM